MFGVFFTGKRVRASCFGYLPSIYVFNLNFKQFLKFILIPGVYWKIPFSHKVKLIKPRVVLCEKLFQQ